MDVQSLPQPVSIYETMGRSAGWLAAASMLARADAADADQAPHLVYLPERPFDVERFLTDLDRVVTRLGWAIVVVPEGLLNAAGQPIFETASAAQRDAVGRALPGGVSAHLAEVVAKRMGIRCRWEKPGLCGRASASHVSPVDREDAVEVGLAAVRGALAGRSGVMVSLRPLDDGDRAKCEFVPLARVAGGDRRVPLPWQTEKAEAAITPEFLRYARPIVGGLLDYPRSLKDLLAKNPAVQGQPV
jgi:6-phosphofructokinase 1